MRIKKIMPIIIALIIILNTLIPTIVLSANEIEEIKGKDNDTIIDNNTILLNPHLLSGFFKVITCLFSFFNSIFSDNIPTNFS